MKVIEKTPHKKTLNDGYHKFCFNWWRLLGMIVLFPLVYFWSKKYVKDFFTFTQTYQRSGLMTIDATTFDFNSFAVYQQDVIAKKLDQFNFSFSTEEIAAMKTATILNQHQDPISILYLQHSNSNKWVIGLHGWTENKYLGLRQVFYFYQQGYNVLTFDSVAHGLSGGNYTGIGYLNAQNLSDVIQWLQANYHPQEIGLIGNSMGAACLTKYLIDEGYQNPLVHWAVSDCGFSNLLVQFRYVMQYRYQHPWWLISFGLTKKFKNEIGFKLRKYNLLKQAKRLKDFPMLIFHGDHDDFVPYFMSKEFFTRKVKYERPGQSQLLSLLNVNHVEAISKGHQVYIAAIKAFLIQQERK
ncbi:alpha/beta hydrolase [Spiroplasma sp. SV19]|uniref:alpha/beta hydrolase n=1 Tax=Spiroplasma sp. SV19 TaxID=2570468 RepID=UPI0024B6ED43|nr:alpha/beta hydrolase [Spiroplasma sp. SV19]WHQ37459.1 prolyl oligopeptidase family serine peptidase [Spiroplasma sp. SV19]